MGEKGNNHLKSITCPSPSLGGVLLIHHPRGLFQSSKVTKNTTKIIRSCLAGLFMGKEGNSYMKSITCLVLLISSTFFPLLGWYITSPSQGWHLKKTGLKKTGFYPRFLLVFFKRILKKAGFYWFFSKNFQIFLKNDRK